MQGASVVMSEGGGSALLTFKDRAKGSPTGVVTSFALAGADHLQGLVGEDSDERMAFGPDGLVVMDRTEAVFGFQGTEDRFESIKSI